MTTGQESTGQKPSRENRRSLVITVVALSAAAAIGTGPAFADHDTAKRTGTIKLPLVRVFQPCEVAPALRCEPPPSSNWIAACPTTEPLTSLTLDKKGKGTLTLKVIAPQYGRSADIKFIATIVGVLNKNDSTCGQAPCPYTGSLWYSGPVTNTDDGLCGVLTAGQCQIHKVCGGGDEPGKGCDSDSDCTPDGKCTNTCTVSGYVQQGEIKCTKGNCVGSGYANSSTCFPTEGGEECLRQVSGGFGQNIELGTIQITDDACQYPPCNPFLAPGLVVP